MTRHLVRCALVLLVVCLLTCCGSEAKSPTDAAGGATHVAITQAAQAPTPTAAVLAAMGEVVQGELYGLEVVGVRAKDSYTFLGTGGLPRTYQPDPGYIVIAVTLRLLREGQQVWEIEEIPKMALLDSTGASFSPREEIMQTLGVDQSGNVTSVDEYIAYFPVPAESTGFKLRYRDLPLIDLGTPKLEED